MVRSQCVRIFGYYPGPVSCAQTNLSNILQLLNSQYVWKTRTAGKFSLKLDPNRFLILKMLVRYRKIDPLRLAFPLRSIFLTNCNTISWAE